MITKITKKHLISLSFIICHLAFSMMLVSCANDIEQPTLLGFDGAEARTLTASTTNVVLDGYQEEAIAVTFNWSNYDLTVSNPDYQVADESITPYMEFAKTADFLLIDTAMQVKSSERSFTNSELNLILSKTGYQKRQQTPLYVRIRYALGENKAPQYSSTLSLQATAYGILFNRMDVLATDKQRIVGTLYSPTENGVYQGYMAATGDWMNFYLRERDNTIYGCVPENAYNMTSDQDNMWNFWLQNVADCYRVTADVNTKTWASERLMKMQLVSTSGKAHAMKFDRKENVYTAIVATTGAETFSAQATTTRYDIEHKDGSDGPVITLPGIVAIASAGTWLVTLDMSGEQPTATYEESSEQPVETYAPALLMIDQDDWNNTKCRLFSPKGDGVYQGFYRTTKGWENFLLATEDKATIWGSLPGSQFVLDSSSDHWNLWGDEKVGLCLYTANLAESSWSQRYIDRLVVRGTIDGDFVDLAYDEATKTWQADITISQADGWGVKILLDDSWDDVLVKKADGKLGYNEGGDIKLPAPGQYRLVVNLFDMENLTYEFSER